MGIIFGAVGYGSGEYIQEVPCGCLITQDQENINSRRCKMALKDFQGMETSNLGEEKKSYPCFSHQNEVYGCHI